MNLKLHIILLLLTITFYNSLVWAKDESRLVNRTAETSTDEALKESLKPTEKEKSWVPSATEFDWVQLTSGEWLKGEIKSMYSDNLEFDSDKLGLLSIDMDDVRYLQSFNSVLVNLESTGSTRGVLNISEDKVSVTHGDHVQTFEAIEIVSFAPGGESESDFWWLKFMLGFDVKTGNTDQIDFSSQLSAKRRTASSNFFIDYIGNVSKTSALSGTLEETINNHRINFNLDRYVTRYFYYTPIFGEYFTDAFQNIDKRYSLGVGIGYTLTDSNKTDWNISAGPSFLSTKYISVQAGDDKEVSAISLSLSTDYDSEITKTIDFLFKYKIQISEKEAGGYTHYINATLENELTDDFDLNVSLIWERISNPTVDQDQNIPEKDDLRFILGITYTY